jgi:hypothetical protein
MFPLDFANTSQDWLILQISLASLRVAHLASHWKMIVDAARFNKMVGLWKLICLNKTDIHCKIINVKVSAITLDPISSFSNVNSLP